jgi:hypothetical protein
MADTYVGCNQSQQRVWKCRRMGSRLGGEAGGGHGRSRPRGTTRALGHNSKAVHHAYSKHAEVTVPSLDDWEKQWRENPQQIAKPAVVQVDFKAQLGAAADEPERAATAAGGGEGG